VSHVGFSLGSCQTFQQKYKTSKQRGQSWVQLSTEHFAMQPSHCESQSWSWRSTGAIVCARCLPGQGNSLPHVARLIDEYVVESLDERVLTAACEHGAAPRDLDFILSRSTPNWMTVVKAAAKGGHVHVFRWMRERQDDRGPWGSDFYFSIDEAARHGHLELIRWLHERGLCGISFPALGYTFENGHIAVVKWLVREGTNFRGVALEQAAQNGHFAMVHWIYDNVHGAVDISGAMAGAARNGDLDMLQWLHQLKRCSVACSTKAMDRAVSAGHFHVVE
jgi:hypothetical protein